MLQTRKTLKIRDFRYSFAAQANYPCMRSGMGACREASNPTGFAFTKQVLQVIGLAIDQI